MNLDINWQTIFFAAASAFILGGIWYGPLFGRIWRVAEGPPESRPGHQKHPALVYGLSFALMLVAAAALAMGLRREPSLQTAICVSLYVGVGWVATSFGVNYLFAGRRLVLLAVDAGYNVAMFALMGLIIGLFG